MGSAHRGPLISQLAFLDARWRWRLLKYRSIKERHEREKVSSMESLSIYCHCSLSVKSFNSPLGPNSIMSPHLLPVNYKRRYFAISLSRSDLAITRPADPTFRCDKLLNGSEKSQKVRFIDGVQHLNRCALDDLILQRCDAERPQPPVGLGDVHPTYRLSPVRPSLQPMARVHGGYPQDPLRSAATSHRPHQVQLLSSN
jgi:hypothetical protein